jgi:hypothetical protein
VGNFTEHTWRSWASAISSDSSSRPRSSSTPATPILMAAAAFDSVVSTNKGIGRRLPLYARQHPPPQTCRSDPQVRLPY